VFYKACTGGFEVKENTICMCSAHVVNQEEFTGVIHMQHLSHLELRYMVNFLYNSDYAETESCPLETHIRMFALADQYEIPALGSLAVEKYHDSCVSSWSPEEFLMCIKDVYEATPDSIRPLRDMACTVVLKHLPQIFQDGNISMLYEKTLDETPGFAKDLLKRYTDKSLYGYCSSCGPGQPMEVLQARCKTCGRGNTGGRSYYSQ
jgi:hypothetical protein